MFKLALLFLTLSGLQAVPLAVPRRLQEISSTYRLPDDFRQGTEPSRRFLVDLNTGLVQEHISEMDRRVDFSRTSLGNREVTRRSQLADEVAVDVSAQRNGGGWIRVEEPSAPRLPDGFRQGTEPKMSIPDGFRQGTERMVSIPKGFRQGTEPVRSIPAGFRQGTEPFISIPKGFRRGIKSMMSASRGLRRGAKPVMSIPAGFRQGTEPVRKVPDGFRQGTEPSFRMPEGFRQGTEPFISIPKGFRQGTEPVMSIPAGFRQGTEPVRKVPDGFRQGTEPSFHMPDGFRHGTEPVRKVPDGFRQGTEPSFRMPDGFRQGTEPFISIPKGFRQGTEPVMSIPDGFRQGTEPVRKVPDGFRQGTEPSFHMQEGFRQGTEPTNSRLQTQTVACKGEVINGNCYEFNPTPLAFKDAQAMCRALAPNAELASVTSGDLHSRLVSLATKGGESSPVLTWLGGTVKNQQASWVDGSEWSYSDWMPGHPNIHTDKPVCVEMFKIDESWWTATDCDLKRASICSYPIAA